MQALILPVHCYQVVLLFLVDRTMYSPWWCVGMPWWHRGIVAMCTPAHSVFCCSGGYTLGSSRAPAGPPIYMSIPRSTAQHQLQLQLAIARAPIRHTADLGGQFPWRLRVCMHAFFI